MSDRFLEHADRARDAKRNPQDRFQDCRKAAEAFCKWVVPGPFPEKVEGNLSRMINHLRSKEPIEEKVTLHLDMIRLYASPQMHDQERKTNDEETEQSLDFCILSLNALLSYHSTYPPLYTQVGAFEYEAKMKLMYDELKDDEIRPAICLNGDEPFGCDQLEGLFRRYGVRAEHMHRAKSFHGNPNVWLVFGRKQWTERTLRTLSAPTELRDIEIDWEPLFDESQSRALKFEYSHSKETGIFEITEFRLSPPDPSAWNVVVMGQEACLQSLCEKNLSITQEDVFNHPLHSKHPAVTKFKTL